MEQAFSNTFYPFQKKQHIQRNIQIVKMLCPLNNVHSTYFISLIQIDTKLIQRSKFTSLGRNLFVLVVHLSITFSISIPHFIEKYFLNKLQRHLFYATERIFSTLMGHPKGERERERRVVSKSGLEFHFLLSAKCCLRRRRRRLRHRMLTPSCRF